MKTLTKILSVLSLVTVLGINVTDAVAQDNKTEKNVKKTDKAVSDIIGANMYETNLLQLATQKAKSQELKDMAAKLLPMHQQMGNEIKTFASSNGYTVEAEEAKKYNGKIKKWESHNTGLELDYDLAEELVDLHKDGIDLLQNAKEDTKDEALKAWIDKQIPMMKDHLAMLQPMKGKMKKPWTEKNRPSPDMREGKQ
jgi:putative membrane protein